MIDGYHWTVFERTEKEAIVHDPAAYLENNDRTDFTSISSKWFIEIYVE